MTDTDVMTGHPAVAQASARRWWALAVLVCGCFMTVLDVFIVHIAVPSIATDLRTNFAEAELVVAAYSLAYAVSLVTGGRLGDIHGRKRLFLWGMAAFTGASVLCGIAPDATLLIAARILQGITAAAMFPQVLTSIRVTFEGGERRRAFGIMGAVMGMGAISGQFLGGWLISADLWGLGWRLVFLINLPIGLIAIAAGWALLTESRAPDASKLDLGGVAIGTTGLVCLVLPLVVGREVGWPAWCFAMLVAALPVLALFLRYEQRLADRGGVPVLSPHLFRDRGFLIGAALMLVFYTTMNSFYFALSVLMQLGLQFKPFDAGTVLTPAGIVFSATSLLVPRLAVRYGDRVMEWGAVLYVLTLGTAAAQVVSAPLALTPASLMPILALMGVGQGLVMAPLLNAVLGTVSERDAGMASGSISTMQQVGGAFGVAIVGALLFGTLPDPATLVDTATRAHAYAASFGTAIAYNTLCAAATWVLLRRLRLHKTRLTA